MNISLSAVLPPAAGIICVVDDDPSMLKALNRLLLSAGLQAQLFSEPLGFLAYVICNTVALAVLDIFMSAMSGLEVQKELQVVSPKTRVIMSTANDHDSVRNAAIQAGAIAYFVKPFDDDAFLAAVHQAMAQRELNALKAMWAGGVAPKCNIQFKGVCCSLRLLGITYAFLANEKTVLCS
jgi:FixJ family two-component response regulator